MISLANTPRLLLTIAVRMMPAERREWGAAMLAELAQLQNPSTRWRFALGCARVALFPPRKGDGSLIGGIMSVYLRKARGVIGIGLIWAPVWTAMFFALVAIIFVVFNPSGGSDVGPLMWIVIMAQLGFESGAIFGIILSLAEHGKAIRDISLARAAFWGLLGSAVLPILTQRADQVFWTCPFGAVIAMALVAIARKADLRDSTRSIRQLDIFFACALMPVRDAVSPLNESAT
ncbi:MAG: hypothetical protein ACREA2_13115 [Blastocatellia bacterium]